MKSIYLLILSIFLVSCATEEIQEPIDYSKISTIYLSNDIINELNNKFDIETLEYVYCLYGKNYKDGILISDIDEAIYLERTPDTYLIDTCPNNDKVIGYLHQHMNGLCYLGPGDTITGLEAIQCRNNKMVFFSSNNQKNSLKVINIDNNNDITVHLEDKDFCPINGNYCKGICYTKCSSTENFICDDTGIYCE